MASAHLALVLAVCPLLFAQEPKLPDISYDSKQPLVLQQLLVKSFGYANLLDISFDSPRGGRVNAYAVIPNRISHPAGIVWQHWGQGDRSSMLPEALSMARRGAASVLINSPSNRPNPRQVKTARESLELWLQEAVDIRRAVDALIDAYGVSAARLAYVGHSYGATLGGVITVGERRFRALVLMGGFASISDSILHPKDARRATKPLQKPTRRSTRSDISGEPRPLRCFCSSRATIDSSPRNKQHAILRRQARRSWSAGTIAAMSSTMRNPFPTANSGLLNNSRFPFAKSLL